MHNKSNQILQIDNTPIIMAQQEISNQEFFLLE